jgi:5-methylcytosine-specific restriction protein B
VNSWDEFRNVVLDEIIPLIEEYCYDDRRALREILGTKLVDADSQTIKFDLFAPERQAELVSALSFEEIQAIALKQDVGTQSPADPLEDDESTTDLDSGKQPAAQ